MLKNNPAGPERADIENVVGNLYTRLLRQHKDSKALSVSKGTTTEDRGEKNKRPRNRLESSCVDCGRKGHLAEGRRSVKEKIENQKMPPPTRRAELGGKATSSVGVRSTLRINTEACAKAWSTGLAIVRSKELRRVQFWPKQWCQRTLRWDW